MPGGREGDHLICCDGGPHGDGHLSALLFSRGAPVWLLCVRNPISGLVGFLLE